MFGGNNKTCERIFEYMADKSIVKEARQKALKRLQKVVSLKGFRKGRVPIEVIEKKFPDKVKLETIAEVLSMTLVDEVKKREIDTLDLPRVMDANWQEDGSLIVKVKAYVWPKIKLANYKKMKIPYPKIEVTDEEVDSVISNYFNKANSQKDDSSNIEINDDLAKKMGFEDAEKLRDYVRRQIEFDKRKKADEDVDRQIREFLLKNSRLDVPDKWVENTFINKIRQMKEYFAKMGLPQNRIDEIISENKDKIWQAAEEDVKMFFIIEEIGRKEGIEASEEEAEAYLEKIAQRYNLSKDDAKAILTRSKPWDEFCLEIDHEKIWKYLRSLVIGKDN